MLLTCLISMGAGFLATCAEIAIGCVEAVASCADVAMGCTGAITSCTTGMDIADTADTTDAIEPETPPGRKSATIIPMARQMWQDLYEEVFERAD